VKKLVIVFLVLFSGACLSQQEDFPFLDNKVMGANNYIKQNPQHDGTGVLIFILDNGVDPSIRGLDLLPNGKNKVIEMRDFSNQIALDLKEAKIENIGGRDYLTAGDIKIQGYESLKFKPKDEIYYLAVIDEESSFKNSAVKDINQNGKTNDQFPIVAFKIDNPEAALSSAKGLVKPKASDEVWVYYLDENSNFTLTDDIPRFEYKYNFDTFSFHLGEKGTRAEFTSSAHIDSKAMKIVLHTNDGSHGSHCAGIAAGYSIYGTEGNDGVAPGAYVASLKIGSNVLSGGATTLESKKRAYNYGIEYMKEAGFKHAVFSMSYGIGSETPGRSEMEKFLTDFSKKNPNVIIITSMGNAGPGVNSTGNPAGSSAIISAGAMLPPETLESLYGSVRKSHWITHFSSRGGETAKPDVVAPGGASSTVPNFERGDAFWGTSMACPQVAGAAAVIISSANANNWEIDGFMVKKAIKSTSKPLQGYTAIDYGSGLVHIPDAITALKAFVDRGESKKILDYTISTSNTFYDDLRGEAAFWKAGGYVPSDKQDVTISSIFPPEVSETNKQEFYRAFNLRSDVDWLKPDKNQLYIRGNLPARFSLVYDKAKLTRPGIYVGRVSAYPSNEKGNYSDFDVQATVIIPYKFDNSNNYKLSLKERTLDVGNLDRVFVEVPYGASSMSIKLSPSGNKHYSMAMYVFSPDGNNYRFLSAAQAENTRDLTLQIEGDDLMPGIWEILPNCSFQSRSASFYDLEVEFFGITSEPNIVTNISQPIGENPEINFKIRNWYNLAIPISHNGSIKGYATEANHKLTNKETFSLPINVGSDVSRIEFNFETCIDNFNKFTDMAINIYDSNGEAVYSDGASRMTADFVFMPKAPGNYKLELVPAFVSAEIMSQPFDFKLNTYYYYKQAITLNPVRGFSMLYPGVSQSMKLRASSSIPMAPVGTFTFGDVEFKNTNTNAIVFKQKIKL